MDSVWPPSTQFHHWVTSSRVSGCAPGMPNTSGLSCGNPPCEQRKSAINTNVQHRTFPSHTKRSLTGSDWIHTFKPIFHLCMWNKPPGKKKKIIWWQNISGKSYSVLQCRWCRSSFLTKVVPGGLPLASQQKLGQEFGIYSGCSKTCTDLSVLHPIWYKSYILVPPRPSILSHLLMQ